MYERFSEHVRKVMALANIKAQRLNHVFIGTEHILLVLIKEGASTGAKALINLGIDLGELLTEVEEMLERGPYIVEAGKLPQTPHSKEVISYAIEESRSLKHKYVGTGHILLGLLRVKESVAGQLLINRGLKLEDARKEVLRLEETFSEMYSPRDMIEGKNRFMRFTDRARKVMALANQEAQRFHHDYIGTEHMLLGLIKVVARIGDNAFANLGIDLEELRTEVKKMLKPGQYIAENGKLPQTQQSKEVIGYAIEEAGMLKHNFVTTGHILLGLLRVKDCAAAQLLINKGLNLEDARNVVLRLY
jgi:ATP-dependent Clp protease ATP-binding subunit ClpA